MRELTYEDFKQRINIQELLVDAGYTLNRRDGLRYPSYVRLDSSGHRVRGDKFIVTANGLCCFQPPEQKNYNVISFIKEHPTLFKEYISGMDKDRLVNLVCRRLLNEPEKQKETVVSRKTETEHFNIDNFRIQTFRTDDWESQKAFYPYFKNRGVNLMTQRAFADHFLLASQRRTDGKSYTNIAFPLSTAYWPGKNIVGLEERGRPNAEGNCYKGMAPGSNASEGVWIARLDNHRSDNGFSRPLGHVKDVYWFESAFDAMAFYQLKRGALEDAIQRAEQHDVNSVMPYDERIKEARHRLDDLGNAVFVSTGGNPSRQQFASMLQVTSNAAHHVCFDRDHAGQMFAVNFAMQKAGKVFTSHISSKGQLVVTDMTDKFQRYELDLVEDGDSQQEENFNRQLRTLGVEKNNLFYEPAEFPYKDWNDQLLGKPISAKEDRTEEIKHQFHR